MVWEIAFIIFLLALTTLVILMIPVVLQFRDALLKFNQTLDVVNKDLPDLLSNMSEVSRSLTITTAKIENMANEVAELEHFIVTEIREPLKSISNIISSLFRIINLLTKRKK